MSTEENQLKTAIIALDKNGLINSELREELRIRLVELFKSEGNREAAEYWEGR